MSNRESGKEDRLILVRLGEITLKGLNRGRFIARLIGNMRWRLKDIGDFDIQQSHSRIWIRSTGQASLVHDQVLDQVMDRLSRVFGIVSLSAALELDLDYEALRERLVDYVRPLMEDGKKASFKMEVRRINKAFPLDSYQLASQLGALLLETYPDQLTVKMGYPGLVFQVEIRDKLYLFHDKVEGAKGLPVGMGGRAMLLLSGGIDSPVAGYMMASRGMILDAI